jgi:hypothetical protein
MSTIPAFIALLNQHGSDVHFHRSDSMIPCPCRTPEGYRDMSWHIMNPEAPMCDENGMLSDPNALSDLIVKAFCQPIQSTRATRLNSEVIAAMFGDIQADDHLGIFPVEWQGTTLNFRQWGMSGEDYVEYANQRFTIVNSNLIPDPDDGNPWHHWETGLRLIGDATWLG